MKFPHSLFRCSKASQHRFNALSALLAGKVCKMNAHRYVDEEEDLEVHGDSLDILNASHGGAGGWSGHRATPTAPDGRTYLDNPTL